MTHLYIKMPGKIMNFNYIPIYSTATLHIRSSVSKL